MNQETIDRIREQANERSELTESVVNKRKQAAALEAAAAVTNPAIVVAELTPDKEKKLNDSLDEKFINEAEPLVTPEPERQAPELDKMSFDDTLNLGMKDAMLVMEMLKKEMKARELREIEMHNSKMDSDLQIVIGMNNVTEALQTMCNMLSDIVTAIKDHP